MAGKLSFNFIYKCNATMYNMQPSKNYFNKIILWQLYIHVIVNSLIHY